MIVTIGLAIVIKGGVMIAWGTFPKDLPAFSGEAPLAVLGASITPQAIWIVGISVFITAAVGFS